MQLDVGSAPSILPRLIGSRELAVGALTWAAYNKYARRQDAHARAHLRQMLLWGNVLVDAGDVLTCLFAVLTSPGEVNAGFLLGASGALAALWGFLGYKGV